MSSESESDDDYVPEEPGQVSEEESADEETNLEFEKELEHKTKRKKTEKLPKGKKKISSINCVKEFQKKEESEPEDVEQATNTPEENKKKDDDLWAKFLEGTDTNPTPRKIESSSVQATKSCNNVLEQRKSAGSVKNKDDREREKRIFEFAGETLVVENNMIKEKSATPESTATASKPDQNSRSRGGGLSSVLGQLNKKNTLSTLEKSKLDWNTYKKEEGIEEEIASINKGKAGYLDRRDFLERTDLRQYEIERDLRMSKRSKR